MRKIIKKHNELCKAVNQLAEYIETIDRLPPTGAGAKAQVCREVEAVCQSISGKAQAVKLLLVDKISSTEGKV